ncbi:hypothetical protein HELRODRAFT_65652 [Helobdella robusta]|uniref:Sulfotransferase domain-containing protein n=1 Tax=Helobdella robusta TaxID=6412 RepID=T1FYB1_HELRO|nr:hypothetical protein HELRODRAFT_65652 [Helobdella robusta]ESO02472.1 hypothetical protein HELRODRAFT_65652 [Helobdella robusta]
MFANLELLDAIGRFQMKNDDILVVSFPKSGTTWVQEIVTQILALQSTISTDRHSNIEDRFPYIEYPYPGLKSLKDRPSPRLLKSHLPYWFMPQSVSNNVGKVIYIARQPKDVCVSYYNFLKMISFLNYSGSFQNFFQNFLEGTVAYGPWIDHVTSFWEHRNDPNILFITYEDLHSNSPKVIKRIADFLGTVLTDQQINEIAKETKFEKMKDNPSVNYSWWDDLGIRNKKEANFMRKGLVRNFFFIF